MFENKEKLAEFLVTNWKYVPSQAPATAEKLLSMDAGICAAFEKWLDTGEFPDTPIFSGFSPRSLNELVNVKPPAVFLLLDWIRMDPQQALFALEKEFKKTPRPKP